MNDSDSPAVADAVPPSPPPVLPSSEAPQERERPAPSALPLTIAIAALILAIGLAVAAYFMWYQVQRLGAEQAGIEAGVSDRIQPMRGTLDGLRQALEQDRSGLAADIDRIDQEQKAVRQRLSVLAAMMGRSERGWTLAEVEYLLRIANQRLQLQRDSATAMQALQSADGRLRDLADPHYQGVREQIAHDLDAVRALPSVDVDGLSATLSAALAQVDELPVAGSHYQRAAAAGGDTGDGGETATTLAGLGKLVWKALSELFRVREHDQAVGPMLPPEREYFLRENLRLQLAAARLALLRTDQTQYHSALQTAQQWLERYFDRQNAGVQQLLGRLQELVAVDIAPVMPDVSASLRLLRQQMQLSEQQQILPKVPATTAAGGVQDADSGGAQ